MNTINTLNEVSTGSNFHENKGFWTKLNISNIFSPNKNVPGEIIDSYR